MKMLRTAIGILTAAWIIPTALEAAEAPEVRKPEPASPSATAQGLPYVYKQWEHFTVKDGLPNDHIFCVKPDGPRVWIGTEDGPLHVPIPRQAPALLDIDPRLLHLPIEPRDCIRGHWNKSPLYQRTAPHLGNPYPPVERLHGVRRTAGTPASARQLIKRTFSVVDTG